MIKKYIVYIDDGKLVFKAYVLAKNEKEAKEYVKGNGEVVGIKRDEETRIDLNKLQDDLKSCGWSKAEVQYIYQAGVLALLDV